MKRGRDGVNGKEKGHTTHQMSQTVTDAQCGINKVNGAGDLEPMSEEQQNHNGQNSAEQET